MDENRYGDRGSSRSPSRGGKDYTLSQHTRPARQYTTLNTHLPKHLDPPSHDRSHRAHQYREHVNGYSSLQQQRESEHAYSSGSGPSRSSTLTLNVASATEQRLSQQTGYRAALAETSSTSTPSLPKRSEWLLLPSVSHALSMYADKCRREPRFSLVIRQQPRRGLAVGNSQMSLRTARSVPIDPPPVCELLIDQSADEQLVSLPEVFIRAQLVGADTPMQECLPDAKRIEPLVGDTLQSALNSRIDTRQDQSFFVFKELGVRNRGTYRLRFDLFDRVGLRIFRIASVYSDSFEVHEKRKHPGLSASSALMDALVDRGMKYKLRKANDKPNPKKRKSTEDFYYGDERSVTHTAAPRQRQATAHFDHLAPRSQHADTALQTSQTQLVQPIAHRALLREAHRERADEKWRFLGSHSAHGRSPTLQAVQRETSAPQLPSLSRLGGALSQPASRSFPVLQLQLSSSSLSSHLPPHPQLHASRCSRNSQQQHEDGQNASAHAYTDAQYETSTAGISTSSNARTRSLTGHDAQRPSLELRSSSSSVATSGSTGREGFTSTPTSSIAEGSSFVYNEQAISPSTAASVAPHNESSDAVLGSARSVRSVKRHQSSAEQGSVPEFAQMCSTSPCCASSTASAERPTLPPITSLYIPQQSSAPALCAAALTHR